IEDSGTPANHHDAVAPSGEASGATNADEAGSVVADEGFYFLGRAVDPSRPEYDDAECLYHFSFDAPPEPIQCLFGNVIQSHAFDRRVPVLTYVLELLVPDLYPELAVRTDLGTRESIASDEDWGYVLLGGTPQRVVTQVTSVSAARSLFVIRAALSSALVSYDVSLGDETLTESALLEGLAGEPRLHSLPDGNSLVAGFDGSENWLIDAQGALHE